MGSTAVCGGRSSKVMDKNIVEVYMIETVANLIDYLSLKLKITNDKFEIRDSNGKSARMGMPLVDLMKEYGMGNEKIIEGIVRCPNKDSCKTEVECFVSEKCNLPDGCFILNVNTGTKFGNIQ